jgi:hypothetical protein
VSVWLGHGADVDRAATQLAALEGVSGAEVAEITPDGVRVDVTAEAVPAARRGARAAQLRAEALRALRANGLLPDATEASPGT